MKSIIAAIAYLSVPSNAEEKLVVHGHKNPDTDAVCAAIAYAWELNQKNFSATAYRLGDLNPETSYVLKAIGYDPPPLLDESIAGMVHAIVDTNNPDELPKDLEKNKIHSIVDHHKLFGLKYAEPVEVDIRTLCSAGSIVYARSKANGLVPPKEVAGCMLSSIISDSLMFRSPTTTALDKTFAEELAVLANLDLQGHGKRMLEEKGKIDGIKPAKLVSMDSKVFTLGGKKVRVGVLETTNPAAPLAIRDELVAAQQQIQRDEKLDNFIFFIVDILNEAATFLSSSTTGTKLVEAAWSVNVGADGTVVLPGVLSRKKQMIPALERASAKQAEL
eukprot:TRINITY_DN76395_c0_g1_i1.p1 TRINITY_DN76395_c0_g1~~TRINITY_DN76395_c0_g1_i1.p1  ORF type:complete len:332 (+),score=80.89 TRINITY_DN76395_c0_g1_i1:80-1075(+)